MTNLTHKDILDLIPHRNENILIDQARPSDREGHGEVSLKIQENDPLNRQLFTIQKTDGLSTLLTSIYMEFLALGAIVCTGEIPKGHIAYFAAITNFKKHKDVPINQEIKGTIEKLSDKGGFYKYKGIIEQNNQLVAEGTVMAFFANANELPSNEEKKRIEIPELGDEKPIKKTKTKHQEMVLVDSFYPNSLSDERIVCKYIYPERHPLTKGHFPGNPVMMGVMQWMMIEDAATIWANHNQATDTITASANIFKSDGTLACEIKGAELALNDNNGTVIADIVATKKVIFRDVVTPGETLFIQLQITGK